jgi:hypothetical protein
MSHTSPDDRPLTAKDLASIDPFHTHGGAATVEVAPGGRRWERYPLCSSTHSGEDDLGE